MYEKKRKKYLRSSHVDGKREIACFQVETATANRQTRKMAGKSSSRGNFCRPRSRTECVHDGHVGGPKQYNDFPVGNIFYFYANIVYCLSPSTWPPSTHSIRDAKGGARGGGGGTRVY